MSTSIARQPALLETPEPEESAEARAAEPRWGPVKRLLFRFAFVYLVLYNIPVFLDFIPFVSQKYQAMWNALVPWFAQHVFHVEAAGEPNGSGDTTWNYVQVAYFALLAAMAAAVWTVLDKKRPHYARLYEWLRIYVRFSLAFVMLGYGVAKVINTQFPDPTLSRLLQPFGNASPMGLLWTFMGASDAYTIFGGAAEMLGGLLLTVRRTTLLGALVSIGVMTNIVMLNFCYDVPVKLFSSHLLLMAVFLAAHDWRRLANLLLLNRPVEPVAERPLFARRRLDRGALVFRTLFVTLGTGFLLYQGWQANKVYGDKAPKPPLYGAWNVEELETDGRVRPPLITDGSRWRWVVVDYPGFISIEPMVEKRQAYRLELDSARHTLTLTKPRDPRWKSVLAYREPQPGVLLLSGTFDGQKVRARLRRSTASDFLLVNRGFHWINETPYNR